MDIIVDDQIQATVLVVVDPSGAGAEFLRSDQACLLRNIRERVVAVVVEKVALSVGGDEKIVIAVVVVVADGHAHPKHLNVESSQVRYVGEGAVMIIVIELGCRVFLDVAGPIHPIHEKNVRPAVPVTINEGHARAHGFGQEFLTERAIVVDEVNSRSSRDVPELNR